MTERLADNIVGTWRPWKVRGKEAGGGGGLVPPVLSSEASAQLIASVMATGMADVVHAAAEAAADFAHDSGVDEAKCAKLYNLAVAAAAQKLDPSAAVDTSGTPRAVDSMGNARSRIENILARSIKKNAVRVVDLFKEWDEDRNGVLSKKEFRNALKSAGIGASSSEVDALFEQWDKDGSGAIDFNELNKALKRGIADLKDELAVDEEAETVTLLGRGKASAVKQAKEAKAQAKERREMLSPRSQQLKDAAERAEAQRRGEMEKVWKEDEATGRRWTAAKWLATRNIALVVADALKMPALGPDSTSQFSYVKSLTREQVEALLGEANLGGLANFVVASIETLAAQATGSAQDLNDKFSTTAKFQMTYGSLSLFYGGLESLLGPPKMYKGPSNEEKSLFNTMEYEHMLDKDAKVDFKAPNGVTTTPAIEWAVVVAPQKGVAYPERGGYETNYPQWCRVATPLATMLEQMEEKCNAKLREDEHSEMILEEMIGGRLYTGPMYIKYNTVLRSKTADPAMKRVCSELTKGNTYTTTIHAINSCVIKMSKLTKAGKVWRGIKDATLPKEFWVPNEMGVRGGIEYGFSSTTTNREQALLYAGGGDQKDAATIFEMQMGMVDRGADLTWLSQYPHEQEVLLPPLTGIEALNVNVDGTMLVIHSRLSLNLASHTLEQVLSRRRKMLLDMIAGIELELRDHLGDHLIHFGIAVLNKALTYGPLSKDPEWFNDDENFAFVMQQTLSLQHAVVTQINKLHVDSTELNLKGWKLTGPARVLLLAGWCNQRVHGSKGSAVHETLSIDLRDSKLTTTEAEQLATLMEAQPRLTALDVRGNPTIGKEGAEALARFIEGNTAVGATARSVCGVTPNKSSLEVPRTLDPVTRRLLCAELRTFVFAEGVSATMGTGPRKDKPVTLNRRGAFAANDWSPLLWAAKENHVELADELLNLGLDINEQQPVTSSLSKFSALHVAAQKGNEDMVKLLVARGIDKTLRDKHNNTALMLAEKKKHEGIISVLGGEVRA